MSLRTHDQLDLGRQLLRQCAAFGHNEAGNEGAEESMDA